MLKSSMTEQEMPQWVVEQIEPDHGKRATVMFRSDSRQDCVAEADRLNQTWAEEEADSRYFVVTSNELHEWAAAESRAARSSQWGGARPGAGRPRKNPPALTESEARMLHQLLRNSGFAVEYRATLDKLEKTIALAGGSML